MEEHNEGNLQANTALVEIPEGTADSPLMLLTWTIAGALNKYDPTIRAHGDSAAIIDFINSMGVDTPM